MHERSLLGPADLTDDRLADVVARWLGRPEGTVELLDATAEVFPYDVPAITTAGRWRVRGRARAGDAEVPFRFFVKQVQSWSRHPLFAQVPEPVRELAEAGVPWRTEPLVYRSDLARRLPDGLTMPRAVAVEDLDEASAVVWLEEVATVPREWTVDRLAAAARLLGRMAASPAVRELSGLGETERSWPPRSYADGRLANQVLPALRDDDVWRHPLVAPAFDPGLRRRLLAAADAVPGYLDELERVPTGAAHGDACPNNLLAQPGSDELVLVDFGFWTTQPYGFDLSQLVVGEVQCGRRAAATLPDVVAAVVPAYVEGLRAEGCDVPAAVVARSHALVMLLYAGLSTIPLEHLGDGPTPELLARSVERAATARFVLDLVDATVPVRA